MTSIRPEVLTRINEYCPNKPHVRENWPVIADTVRAAVITAAPDQISDAYELCSRASGFVNWAVRIVGSPNTPAGVFTARNIDRYADARAGELSPRTTASHTSKLRLIMRAINGSPARRSSHGKLIAGPYSQRELAAHLAWARTRGTPARRATAVAALALGVGAGLRPREIAAVEEQDLVSTAHGGLEVVIRGAWPRTVPVVALWGEVLRGLVQGELGRRLVMVGANTSGLLSMRDFDMHTPPFTLTRLRITWCVAAAAALPAPEFMRAAGLKTMSSLDPFIPHLSARPESVAAPVLRGLSF